MIHRLADVPIQIRMNAVWDLAERGEDLMELLSAAILPDPDAGMLFDGPSEFRRIPEPGDCANGHPWEPENIYMHPDGRRSCRTCRRSHQLRYRGRL